jgi:hypothetical protein
MEKIATPCADLEMTNLVIILVMLMGTKSALMGGKKILKTQKETTVPKLYAALDVIMSMDTATVPANANVAMDMKVHFVINVSDILDANMANVMNLGLAIVKKVGVVYFATKI